MLGATTNGAPIALATIPGPLVGSGTGTLSVNDGAPIAVSISFTAVGQHNKYTSGSFVMTDSSGVTIGAGSITSGHLESKGYSLSGTLGASGVFGVNSGADFTITGSLGSGVPIAFMSMSRLPGGGCLEASFVGTVQQEPA